MLKIPSPLSFNSVLPWEDGLNVGISKIKLHRVSIVIPIFKSGAFLEKTIRSLMCNDLNGVEIILIDGGSTDTTMEIVNYYKDIFTFIHSGPDEGQSDAINKGFEKATGDIFYWLNGDDLILPNTLNEVRKYYRNNPSCEVLVGDAYMTELDLAPINHFQFSIDKLTIDYLLDYAKNHLIQPSVFFSRKAWNEIGPLRKNYHYAMDADLFIGMAKKYKFHHIQMDIAYSVYHGRCKTRGKRAESITELALVQAKHGGIEQARRTLDILVDLFNKAEKCITDNNEKKNSHDCIQCKFNSTRIKELEDILEQNRQTFLEIDMVEHI